MIKAVIFDNNGVIIQRSPKIYMEIVEVLKDYGWKGDVKLFHKLWEKTRISAFQGKESLNDSIIALLDNVDIESRKEIDKKLTEIRVKSRKTKQLYLGVKETLTELRNRGLILAVLTDTIQSAEQCKVWFDQNDIQFDRIFSSTDLGYTKHDKEIFTATLKELGLIEKEVVFVGHSSYEIATSMRSGILTVSKDPEVKGDINITDIIELPQILDSLRE